MERDKELEKLKILMNAMRSNEMMEPLEWEQELREGSVSMCWILVMVLSSNSFSHQTIQTP